MTLILKKGNIVRLFPDSVLASKTGRIGVVVSCLEFKVLVYYMGKIEKISRHDIAEVIC